MFPDTIKSEDNHTSIPGPSINWIESYMGHI